MLWKKMMCCVLLGSGLVGGSGCQPVVEAKRQGRLSGPYTCRNLHLFLIHGKERRPGGRYITLGEGMRQGKVKVYETGNVNRLEVENLSHDRELFIMAGDIVKGGKQDRVIRHSQVLAPQSGRVAVASFCVEAGRWTRRGRENVRAFHKSDQLIASKQLKLGIRKEKSQGKVWDKVAAMQQKLGKKTKKPVTSTASPTSLQLTLENRDVQEAIRLYRERLLPIINGKEDVVGYVAVINGSINSGEAFASPALFRRLWSKLLRAVVIEAVAEYREGAGRSCPSFAEIEHFLASCENSRERGEEQVNRRTAVLEKESERHLLFETKDNKQGRAWINKSYIKK